MKVGRTLAIGILAAAFATVGMASPAQAVDRNCYDGYFCVYKDSNFSTNNSMYRFNYSNNWWNNSQPEIFRADSSWRNFYSLTAHVCDYGTWSDTTMAVLGDGWELSYAAGWNDKGEGHEWSTC
ncbi:hypothetical protein [Catellatospora vulcania]|uniref:hypothetical protein n=1 Tax=Catellatospora vulcania TaxID=1460450 RepID=UPI0012D4BA6B|nr:hypothetical protein [Catellatospora vulcania]